MAVAVLLSAVCACTDEAPPSPPMGGTDGVGGFDGTGGSGGNGGTAGSGGTGGTAGAGGSGGVGGASAGACDNPDDIAALADLMSNAREVSATCAVTRCQLSFSQGKDEFTICVGDCVEEDIPGLSSQCALCYADLEWCIGDVLIWTRCAEAPCGDLCLTTPTLQCRNELDLCTGRMSTDCDV